MNFLRKIIIYTKMSVKAFLKRPSLGTLLSSITSFSRWNKSHQPSRDSVSDKQPWLTFSAIDKINGIVNIEMRVFEFGSGGSTLFWSQHVRQVISVEHDKSWYERLKNELQHHNIGNVEYILAEAQDDEEYNDKRIDNPEDFISGDTSFKGKNFVSYVKQIDKYPDEYFDIVVVDGRARPSCIVHSLDKVKVNGFLIIDNAERDYYLRNIQFKPHDWEEHIFLGPVPYVFHISETRLLKKINSTRR
jgi:hypothetical protein